MEKWKKWKKYHSSTSPLLVDHRSRRSRPSSASGAYRSFGSVRLPSGGEALWHGFGGPFTYIELTIGEVQYHVGAK